MTTIDDLIASVLERRAAIPAARSMLVGVSGIDGSGKGYLAAQMEARLALNAVSSVILNVDAWLNLPEKRFDQAAPAQNFYDNAVRFDEFFTRLVIPLRDRRSVHLVADALEETASTFQTRTYDFKDVPVVLVEGIFLFKPQYRSYFDLAVWIDCSFPTALARAIDRGQEGLSAAKTIAAYETIYFPAQRIHMLRDKPRENADLILDNDAYAAMRTRKLRREPSVLAASTFHR